MYIVMALSEFGYYLMRFYSQANAEQAEIVYSRLGYIVGTFKTAY